LGIFQQDLRLFSFSYPLSQPLKNSFFQVLGGQMTQMKDVEFFFVK